MRSLLLKLIRVLSKRFYKQAVVDGLWVGAGDHVALGNVLAALALIKTCEPNRYSRLTKDLKGILVDILPGAIGQYNPSEDFCDLDERFVASAMPDKIAAVIIHEATHARLWHRGIRYEESVRARVEHACIRRERHFASKLPDALSVVHGYDHRLAAIDADFCSDKSWNRRNARGATIALRHLGAPHWLIAFVVKMRRAQGRRQRRRARQFG